jgi:uncharacterized protein YdhG (YjbR/CyaY superfamily)
MAMTSSAAENIDAFIAQYPPAIQKQLKQLRATINKSHKGFEEAIAYGIPTFRLNKKNVVHFSGYDRHIGFYPGANGIAKFLPELKGYSTSKGTVQFPVDEPLPVELVTRMVKWCASEAEARFGMGKKVSAPKKAAAAPKKTATKAVKKKS